MKTLNKLSKTTIDNHSGTLTPPDLQLAKIQEKNLPDKAPDNTVEGKTAAEDQEEEAAL